MDYFVDSKYVLWGLGSSSKVFTADYCIHLMMNRSQDML